MNKRDGELQDGGKIIPLQPKKVAELLGETGPFAAFFEKYEPREPQLKLTEAVCTCFNDSSVGVFEAGTGVGKSLAYLLPSIIWAKRNKKRVAVSTGTINLQQQLLEKDVPAAKKILGKEFSDVKFILIKGRQNFLCLRRLSQAVQEADFFSGGAEELQRIKEWAGEAKEGSRSELDFLPSEQVWSSVCSESDNCHAEKCAYFHTCFVMKLKREAESSAILIVNHHILFADLAIRAEGAGYDSTAVLPAFENIVIDEAHAIEDAAESFFSHSVSRFDLHKQINLLHRFKRGKQTGLLMRLASVSEEGGLLPLVLELTEKTITAFTVMEERALRFLENAPAKSLTQIDRAQTETLLSAAKSFSDNITGLIIKLEKIINAVDGDADEENILKDASVIVRRLRGMADLIENFLNKDAFLEDVFWFEKIRLAQGEAARFIQTPLNMAPIMRRSVFLPMASVICVSATLKTGGSFDFWLGRNGLKNLTEKKTVNGFFPSPFPYEKNVVLNIPSDIPMPDAPGFQDSLNKAVAALLEITNGKTLVLFTSYESLKKSCEYVRSCIKADIRILRQGEADRMVLLNEFKNDISSCLFATASFWAGVDVPGESLSHVILAKLPFSVPSDPIFKAKSDLIDKSGGNSFMHLSVPQAVIQFRQGFGRLMRSGSDRGIVTVLDKRILVKRYGQIFIQSIPKTIQCFAPLGSILNKTEDFLYNE